ncbi:hypothetical protein P9112_005081 [Eukaryota sp. TZLM1-RC]
MTEKPSKEAIKVLVRVRPTPSFAHDNLVINDRSSITTRIPAEVSYGPQNQKQSFDFTFDGILHNASQEEVYQSAASALVHPLINGYNGTVFAYGQTGSGKTYSIVGETSNFQARGIIPRVLSDLFIAIDNQPELDFTIKIGFLEIYNDSLTDLLRDVNDYNAPQLSIQESQDGNISVSGQRLLIADTEEKALSYLFEGEANRSVASHVLNQCSSRSHAIFSIFVESRTKFESPEIVTFSKLHLVDLAGSERVKKTNASGSTLDEAKFINKSLSFLEQVIVALDKKRSHVPFRQSKLGLLLKDSLVNCNTTMIATISGELANLEETVSTLRFASRVRRLKTTVSKNSYIDPQARIKQLENEVKLLKQELAMYDSLNNRTSFAEPTEEFKQKVEEDVELYITNDLDEIEIKSVTQMYLIMQHFKKLILQKDQKLKNLERSIHQPVNFDRDDVTNHVTSEEPGETVGDEENSLNFSLGRELPPQSFSRDSPLKSMEQSRQRVKTPSISTVVSLRAVEGQVPKNEAFEIFKKQDGSELQSKLIQLKNDLKKKKTEAKVIGQEINSIKSQLDELKSVLDNSEPGSVSEEVNQFEALKLKYKNIFELFKTAKIEISSLETNIDAVRAKLIHDFENWYSSTHNVPSIAMAGELMDSKEIAEVTEDQNNLIKDPESVTFFRAQRTVKEKKIN